MCDQDSAKLKNDDDFKNLARTLILSDRLRKFDLSSKNIADRGLYHIAKGLKAQKCLESIKIELSS